ANWATAISKGGGADESSQTVSFVFTANDNAGLFSARTTIHASCNYIYTPSANANGVTNLSVKITDNGGTANGGVDASAAQNFKITVNAVNDAPSFTQGAEQTLYPYTTLFRSANWATAISKGGGADESSQTVSFVFTANDNAGLF